MINNLIKQLYTADPEVADMIIAGMEKKKKPLSLRELAMLVEETIWAMSVEISFGRAVATGYLSLSGQTDSAGMEKYQSLVRKAGNKGPTIGSLTATSLVPVLKHGGRALLENFLNTSDTMQKKGTYTLKRPFETLARLLNHDEVKASEAYLDLLFNTFSKDLSYNLSKHLANIIPKAVLSFSCSKREWQIKMLQQVINTDVCLCEHFIDGIKSGLNLLLKDDLKKFVLFGLKKYKADKNMAAKFLSLKSKHGIDTYKSLQIAVPLIQVEQQIDRYLKARTGLPLLISPVSLLPNSLIKDDITCPSVFSDGKTIYLPDEISSFNQKKENINLYKSLVRMESGAYEFNTFDFDAEKFKEKCCDFSFSPENKNISDMERFFLSFPVYELASDLFTIFEHGRLKLMLAKRYPGLIRRSLPVFQKEIVSIIQKADKFCDLSLLYGWIALDIIPEKQKTSPYKYMVDLFNKRMEQVNNVETSAELVAATYDKVEKMLLESLNEKSIKDSYTPMQTPFNRRIRPELFYLAFKKFDQLAQKIKSIIKKAGYKVYKSEIRKLLMEKNGNIYADDIKEIIISSNQNKNCLQGNALNLSDLDLPESFFKKTDLSMDSQDTSFNASWYTEWDSNIRDYLNDHVRVLDKYISGCNNGFYEKTLNDYSCLVKKIRFSFELIKPEDLKILRHWVEGDEFDYKALLDFAIDKKSGHTPSERLYIKKIKQQRDVAVMLLVDLSKSTANIVSGLKKRVIDVEKEAIVLFCEALEVLGDSFAIAGFSGTGRLGVDYYHVKDFDEKLDNNIKQKINAMEPQRSTRMGGAIRHAAGIMEKVSAKLRLIIILGDGFPNDLDYKKKYAIEDTKKAIFETFSKNIYTHAITVNFSEDSGLDELYGNLHHNLISDVHELPDKLTKIYRELTR